MADKYDYREAVKNDLIEWIEDGVIEMLDDGEFDDIDEMREYINDNAWMADSVTGNGSGSYTFSTWQAEENLAHNWDLLEEALSEFGYVESIDLSKGAEYYDVTIRCYLLPQVIDDALEELGIDEDDRRFNDNKEEEEEE